ncbi:MAG: substrate-binding domain-containing protein [Bacteroidales bacterium]|nr:substrate-binding domain-containing protein [Bacteroidales bacterium]
MKQRQAIPPPKQGDRGGLLEPFKLLKPFKPSIVPIVTIATIVLCSCSTPQEPQYRIGVSQCSEGAWREKQNAEMERELLLHDGIAMELRSADDDSRRQIDDIRYFVNQKVDLLIVSPYEAETITPIVSEVYDAGIPVVVFDRRVEGDKYTAFVGGDNEGAGRLIARYALSLSKQGGQILELAGDMNTTPAQLRHQGFIKELEGHPEWKLLATVDAHWSGEEAAAMIDSLLTRYPNVDVVAAHSDWMAWAAKDKTRELRPENNIHFVGIDGIVGKGQGIEAIEQGRLDATATYPTGGDIIMRTAIQILTGQIYEKETLLESHLIASREEALLTSSMQRAIDHEAADIRQLRNRLDEYWRQHSLEKALRNTLGILLLLALGLMLTLYLFYRNSRRTSRSLARQRATLKEQRDQLLTLTRELEEANNAKMNFFTNVSHDFRTPLTLISAPIEKLSQDTNLQDAGTRQLLQLAQKNIGVLRRLVNQILDFRKTESGKMTLDLQPIDLNASLSTWTDSFQTLADKRKINLFYLTSGRGFKTMADEAKLERIFYNIMGNAFKFTPDGGDISVSLAHTGDNYIIRIGDSGPGIAEEDLQKIFDSYYQADTLHYEGTGLGLALAKNFVTLHGGTIQAQNQPTGTGCIFTISLPARAIENSQSSLNTPSIPSTPIPSSDLETLETQEDLTTSDDEPKPIALIIDDNADIRLYLRTLLAEKYRTLSAANGEEGLRKAQAAVPDVIICDVMMPVMDGLECCRRLKTMPATSHIPVLMLTACSMDEQRVRGLEEGADAYIAKPFSNAVLLAQMDSLIRNRARVIESAVPTVASKTTKRSTTPAVEKSVPTNITVASTTDEEPASPRLSKYDEEFLEKLHQLIQQHLSDEGYSIELLSSDICLSRTQLFRKCKALTGTSPVELLRNTRLQAAQQLLAEGKGSVAEVAYSVGFADASYFTRCYKAYFGTTPHEINKQKY